MPNLATPKGNRYTGWFKDEVNGVLDLYYKGTLVRSINATSDTIDAAITTNFDGAVDFDSTVDMEGGTPSGVMVVAYLGSAASLASDGANALIHDVHFVAPYDLVIDSVWAMNMSASDVTQGTATSETSYRRTTLVTNTAGTGSGTDIVASLNATASAASKATRAFTIAASTVPAGAIIIGSQLTVGAASADATNMADRLITMAYHRV
ncbi:MAG: hypothetical protein U0990_12635 [Candidatus Nanopelagicales bacterium]|nr:hypothetical protein [Candidatus Nanopelagicales bacterium]